MIVVKNTFLYKLVVCFIICQFIFLSIGYAKPPVKKDDKAKKEDVKVFTDVEIEEILNKPVQKNPYTYTAGGRRDPFMSIVEISKRRLEQTRQKKKKRVLMPLERYKLSDLKVIGIVAEGNNSYASVVLPDGKAYTVRKGTAVGIYGGWISEVKEDRILVKEESVDYYGNVIINMTEIKLREEEKE
ncbi:MAG: pilus assembly protein PilP [Candidatus Magnetoovum sp. WYHC-5]|nr:pilus assembly protein PilP [Candidatus Magnetoovum sp. WYHC-5]